ncbi:tyrosine-type recombinase/integrase [Halobacillus campisalis]|uniref:Tyrosine-type recombinase/integrase n=1 Tax=Halobacillus campisalis TaxID=435909 RepID=A0ABW2K4I4_9BACI|nr:site-specific integrase [Halobacillus campisalis]
MGSIEKRGKGSFRLSVVTGYDAKGKAIRERRNVKVRNKTLARQELAKFESEVLSGDYTKPTYTKLEDFYEEWLTNYAEDHFAPRTKNEYINIIQKRILPQLGHLRLMDIKPMHVVDFIDQLKKGESRFDGKEVPLSSSTIRNCYKALNSLLSVAADFGLIKNNPAKNIKLPTNSNKNAISFSKGTIDYIIECIGNEPFEKQVMFWIAFVTGCREGELVAIEGRHILPEKSAIRFEQSLTQVKGEGLKVKSIKNGMDGTAAVPVELMTMIDKIVKEKKRHFMKLRDRWYDPEHLYLFSDELGKPMRPDSVSQWWGRFRKRYDIGNVRFHDLRHYSVTYLI